MFKLMIVGGPLKGQAYQVKDGETSIGRVAGNDIVLQSQKVSKKHCVLVVSDADVTLKDAGSSNGTFVNGVLTRLKKLAAGDRVSVGEYVLELRRAEAPKSRHLTPVPFSGGDLPVAASPMPSVDVPPSDVKSKVKFYFEKYVINFVYNLNEKHEWQVMMAGMFVVLTVAAAVLSIYPVLDRVSGKLGAEAAQRALLLARAIVDRNAPFIYGQVESKADVSYVEREPGVKSAYLLDMEGRVLAPGRKLNQYLTEANEAAFSATARDVFANKEATEQVARIYGNTVAVAVPVKIFNQSSGKNEPRALGLVFFDRDMIMFDPGTEALSYIQAVILSGIVAVIIFFSLYRLTLRPLLALNDDIDQVLKGTAGVVNRKYKMQEIEPLIDVINAALQRASNGNPGGGGNDGVAPEEVVSALKFAGNRMVGAGMMIFSADRRILHVSPFMEEVTGIRSESASGSDIGSAARDSAFVSFVEDALSRASSIGSGMEPLAEDFEFSGTNYKMECVAIGAPGAVKVYVLTAMRPA